ncbi:MAG: hypothetical protein EA387_13200, partial [Nitriliruptor sp.]
AAERPTRRAGSVRQRRVGHCGVICWPAVAAILPRSCQVGAAGWFAGQRWPPLRPAAAAPRRRI